MAFDHANSVSVRMPHHMAIVGTKDFVVAGPVRLADRNYTERSLKTLNRYWRQLVETEHLRCGSAGHLGFIQQ